MVEAGHSTTPYRSKASDLSYRPEFGWPMAAIVSHTEKLG